MPAWLSLILFVAFYLLLTLWVFPKLGVPTWRTATRPGGSPAKSSTCSKASSEGETL